MRFAVVALLPEVPDDEGRAHFTSREFEDWTEFAGFMGELEETYPKWRVVSVVHVGDLPLLMEPPEPPS